MCTGKKLSGIFIMLTILFAGCVQTIGEIKDNRFYLSDNYTVTLLDDNWEVVRQKSWVQYGRTYTNTDYSISFGHKKSNGFIGIISYVLSDVGKSRSLEVHADSIINRLGAVKLSQKMIKIDGVDAVELVMSSKYMIKWIFLKKDTRGYEIIYSNTSAYFDEYSGVFNKFVETFKLDSSK